MRLRCRYVKATAMTFVQAVGVEAILEVRVLSTALD
jgi:hypothetical protein